MNATTQWLSRGQRALDYVRDSFWAIPIFVLILAGLLSALNLWLDTHVTLAPNFSEKIGINLDGIGNIRSVLSTTAAAILGVAGVSFSITIASLTLASQQFGPRLIRTFIRDRFIQVTLGFFVATFFYCMLTMQLSTVFTEDGYLPVFSLISVLVLTFVDLVLLVLFIHHICVAIQVDSVINEVVTEMQDRARLLFTQKHVVETDESIAAAQAFESMFDRHHEQIKSEADGYVTFINYETLLKKAEESNLFLQVVHRAGDYVMTGTTIIKLLGSASKDEQPDMKDCVIVSETRTPAQDLEYTVRQLVEIALRALSPGINDPFTAMTCIDRLGSLLNFVAKKSLPAPLMEDSHGQSRLLRDQASFSSIVEAAFNQLRQAAADHVDVSMRLLEVFTKLLKLCKSGGQAEILVLQACLVRQGALSSNFLEHDEIAIAERYQEFVDICHQRFPDIANKNSLKASGQLDS